MFFGTTYDIFKQLLDIFVVAFVIYQILAATKGTRTVHLLILLLVLMGTYLVAQERFFDLPTFRWLLDKFWSVIFLMVVILYQDDIRRSIARFRWLDQVMRTRSSTATGSLEEVVKAVRSLSSKRLGALIVIERNATLDTFSSDSGIAVDAVISKELLFALFLPEHENPTHDGAVIVSKGRITAAGVILPLTTRKEVEAWVGTRHRAALGLSEQVDAVVVVVSEETGRVSMAVAGELRAGLSIDELREFLLSEFSEPESGTWLTRIKAIT